MTAASTAAPSVGPRPPLLTLAAILLAASAILALLLPLSLFTDRAYVGCSVAVNSANATPTATASGSGSPSPTPSSRATTSDQLQAQLNGCIEGTGPVAAATDSDTSQVLQRQLLAGIVPFVLLGGLAFFTLRGVPLVRWFVVGLWVISNLYPLIPFSLLQLTGLFSGNLPPLFAVVFVLGTATFTGAAVLVNLPPVVRYFNSKRPVRATAGGRGAGPGGGGLFGGLFGPRPARGGTAASGPSSSRSGVSMTKPASGTTATTRPPKSKGSSTPGGGSGNTGRPKGKRRG